MKKLLLALSLIFSGPALAQNTFTMPPPGGVVLNGFQVVTSCGSASLTAGSLAYAVMDITGKLCINSGSVAPANVTPTDCSGTITLGGTAQNAIAAQTTLHGFTIMNIDASAGSGEPLWVSFTGIATASTAGSYALPAPAATTFVGSGAFLSPSGFGTNHAVSVVAATTGHKFSCTWW